MKFSQRYGYKPIKEIVQIESMDTTLRNGLWSLLLLHVWNHARQGRMYAGYSLLADENKNLKVLCERMWFKYFELPLDQLGTDWSPILGKIREYFFSCEWYEAYDFIEFVANNYVRYGFPDAFIQSCNALLEKEVSAYRFVDKTLSRITETEQLQEIELALSKASNPIRVHLQRALDLLSDRNNPDYRNSIKESISAVECLAVLFTGSEKGTLGQLIKKLEQDVGLHPSLRNAFSNLYGYTNDEGGIRHALLDQSSIKFEDAKFFLVICSAFTNYIEAKAAAIAQPRA